MTDLDLGHIVATAGFLLLGALGTAIVALSALNVTDPLQGPVYRTFYLRLGPSGATEVAILTHFLASGVVAISVPTILGEYASSRLENARALAVAIAGLAGLLVAFGLAVVVGIGSFPAALAVLGVGAVGVPLVLRYHFDVRSGSVPVFVGGIPVLLLLLFAAGFGLGWGWGYTVTAQEIPAESVNETEVVTFEDEPAVREDLFTAERCQPAETGRECQLQLRGYDRERDTARLLARHGVRCPYQNARGADASGTALVEHDGAYYRVRCSPHGD